MAVPYREYALRQNLLYTLYAIPNMALPFFGGAIVDRYGTAVTLVGFSTLILVGQMVFAEGSSFSSFNLMLVRFDMVVVRGIGEATEPCSVDDAQVGRFIVGLGGESLQVAQETLVVAWFKHEELGAEDVGYCREAPLVRH
jgi:MFS family permease